MAQGIIWGIQIDRISFEYDQIAKMPFYPLSVVMGVMIYGFLLPGNYTNVGFIFFYPIYGDTFTQSLFTTGTWQIIYFLCWLWKSECNAKFNEGFYKLYTESSMFVYIFHDMWINVLLATIVYPFKLSFAPSIVIVVLGSEFLSIMTYSAVNSLICPCRKKRKQNRPELIEDHLDQGEFERN